MSGDLRRRLAGRSPDPVGVLVALAALAVFLVHGFQAALTRDLGIYTYGAQQTVDGVPPYVSVLNRAGPLAHLVPAVGVLGGRLVGIDDLLAARLLMMLLSIGCAWVVYLLGRDLFGSRLAGLLAGTALLTIEGFVTYATGGPREKTAMLLFLVLALWALAHRRWAAAGCCVALATLTWQPAVFTLLAAALVAAAGLRGRALLRGAAAFVVGGLVPTALVALGFALAGAFRPLLDGFMLIGAEYTVQPGLVDFLDGHLYLVVGGFGASIWVLLVGLPAAVAAAVAYAPRALRDGDPRALGVVGLGAATLGSFFWTLQAFNGWADLYVAIPLAALGFGAIAHLLLRWLRGRAGAAVVAVLTAAGLVWALAGAWATRDDTLEEQRANVRAVLAAAPPDATIQSVGAPEPLVLSGMTNPSRHQMLIGGLQRYVDDTYPGGLAGWVAAVEERAPTFLVFDKSRPYVWMAEMVRREYVRIGNGPGWSWYAHRSLGPETVRELREANDGVRARFATGAPAPASGTIRP